MTVIAVAAALLAFAPSAGAARGWTRAQSFGGTDVELTPRAGIASDGTSAVAWATRLRALVVSTGGANGHFGAPRVIRRGRPSDWSVAAARGGAFVVAWGDADGLRVAVRTATGRPILVRRILATPTSAIDSVQVAADPRGGWVIAAVESPKRGSSMSGLGVRAVSLDRAGRPLGRVQDLGVGQFEADARQTQAVAVDPQGRAVLAFARPAPDVFHVGAVVVSARPHGGVFGEPAVVPGPAVEPRVAVARGARAAIAVTRTDECPEAGCFGPPGVALLAAGSAPASPFGPSLADPERAYAPTVALTARDRGVLVFQTKTTRSLDSKQDPVRAVTFAADASVGPLQTLTSARANEPAVLPLSGGRALALWAGPRRLGAALAGPDGRFQKTAAPAGAPPEPGHINPTNRDLRTAGRYAILAWESNGRARISVGRF